MTQQTLEAHGARGVSPVTVTGCDKDEARLDNPAVDASFFLLRGWTHGRGPAYS